MSKNGRGDVVSFRAVPLFLTCSFVSLKECLPANSEHLKRSVCPSDVDQDTVVFKGNSETVVVKLIVLGS